MSLSQISFCLTNTIKISKSLLIKTEVSPHSFGLANKIRTQNEKEAPLCTSARASYTVEAALLFPLFLTFLAVLFFLMRALFLEAAVQRALDATSRQAAVFCANRQELSLSGLASACDLRIAEEKAPVSFIDGDIAGISYLESDIGGNYIDLVATYRLSFPFPWLGRHGMTVRQHSRSRKWIGWDPAEGEQGDYVYVTANGSVYHTTLSCTYLHPSIEACAFSELGSKRNEDGGRYQSCKTCHASKNKKQTVYVTRYGQTYHCSLRCSSLKRTIERKKREEAAGMRPCKKCGGT